MKQGGGEYVIAALVFTLSPVHDDAHYAAAARKLAQCPDIDAIYIKDPGGLLSPKRAQTLIPAVKAVEVGHTPLELHAHCTAPLASGRTRLYLDAPDYGVSVLQYLPPGRRPMAPSNPPAERIVANLRELGHSVSVDDEAFARSRPVLHAPCRGGGSADRSAAGIRCGVS